MIPAAPACQPAEALALAAAGRAVLLDVRTPAEFRAVHAKDAVNVPLDLLTSAAVESAFGPLAGREVLVLCKSGLRAAKACALLEGKLSAPHRRVEGGTDAWVAAGLPVTRGEAALSLDRQVRIVIGLLVLAGTAAGAWWTPALLALPAALGAGLLIAGVTSCCPLTGLLGKCPWNQ